MRKLELLAPAKNLQSGIAAIDHGADAVYIGPPQFGARAAAGNSIADIQALCSYAHPYGAKVYATVNTLLRDDELPQAVSLLAQLADTGVDAVLIQDMRLLSCLNSQQESTPSGRRLTLHASTQADNRTAEKVRWLYERGIRRAVLARELSVREVAAIHQALPEMELEVFVHGALCVSYSGLCHASEHCFHRSANRGECAQFCRMQFDLLDADCSELMHQKHLLSLKDLNLSHHLGELIESGATSFKIEGRLKDVAYVKNVTAAYSQLLNDYIARHPGSYERSSRGSCRYTFRPDLSRTFNRGYTTYFAHGRQSSMANFHTPKAIGQQVGTVKELRGGSFTVAGTSSFANGDGLCFFDARHQLQGFRVNRVEGNRLFPQHLPPALRPGMPLYRSNDQQIESILSKPSAERKLPVTISLSVMPGDGEGFVLHVADEHGAQLCTFTFLAAHQQANTPQHENIVRQLSKLGNTPYLCKRVDIPADFSYFIPSSQLAEWRRHVVEHLKSLPALTAQFHPVTEEGRLHDSHAGDGRQGDGAAASLPYSGRVGERPLMQCRYCLRHELGFCLRHGGRRSQWKEPLRLRLGDGRMFRLEFDCAHCQMNVYADEK